MKISELIFKNLAVSVIFFLILFISAGSINYRQGWIYVSINLILLLLTFLNSMHDKELIQERLAPGKGIKRWDKMILGVSSLIYIFMLVIAGLDSGRYNASPSLPWGINIIGIVLMLFGHNIFLTAKKQNKFFSSVVRIQTERGHTVCDTGLYKIVRHPGYFGMMISTIGFPFLLSSLWSVIPVMISILLLIIRTHLEDKTLINELDGYKEYIQKTKYRLIPMIW
jgi:protein-S-isoprenylcysteine O-methyltransferase Ste14